MKNATHLIIVLDESGSMWNLRNATIEGVNALVRKQKDLPGDFTTALYKFSTKAEEVQSFEDLSSENYTPLGGTALFDALCLAIRQEGERLATLKEENRPNKVVVLVVTDGQENSSTVSKLDNVKADVARQRDTYSWEFVFLGANIDAFMSGNLYGFAMNSTMQFDPTANGVLHSYAAVSSTLTSYRAGSLNSMDLRATTKA